MRNLKKFLALVLALMMTFSLMLTANATNTAKDFSDASNITEEFKEATDVLTGMKVFQGDEGGFRPSDKITRAEVAALLYRLVTGDVDDNRAGAYAGHGGFTDVPANAWYAGYVGYCANDQLIKGTTSTTFEPDAYVTGYQVLAMVLRAIGYDKNGEFTGADWETQVAAVATERGILKKIKTTHYGNTLYLDSRRDVVAELMFEADIIPMVAYTPAFGYQITGLTGGPAGNTENRSLGNQIFGLNVNDDGILLGNQQTGEGASVMGYSSSSTSSKVNSKPATTTTDGAKISLGGGSITEVPYSAYTWKGTYNVSGYPNVITAADTSNNGINGNNAELGNNISYELETGIDLIGHRLKLWYDDGSGVVGNGKRHVFAYFDQATLTDVVTVVDGTGTAQTNPTAVDAPSDNATNGGKNLFDLARAAGFKVAATTATSAGTTTHFNNSFGRFGSDFTVAGAVGDGVAVNQANTIQSPVRLYKLISNSGSKSLDAVIALNIESSQITEANTVNRVPTIGMPVMDNGTVPTGADNLAQLETMFVTTQTGGGLAPDGIGAGSPTTTVGANVKSVNNVLTGVIAQNALVGNSTKTLGDYEFGIHITGTSPRTVSNAEREAINTTGAERAYFLLSKVTAPVEGTVVAYNANKGTVTLDNGTVLERSKYYHTVVGWANNQPSTSAAPNTAIPQGWIQGGTNWEEGYANVAYKFYLDHEGKYLGAERTFGSTFLYGTYMDYSQETSTSTFKYYLTGVNMDGEIDTVQLNQYWAPTPTGNYGQATATTLRNITGTTDLGVPFRDTYGTGGNAMNGIGQGVYRGFAITGTIADGIINDPGTNRNEYLNNMGRMGIHNGANKNDVTGSTETAFSSDIQINNTSTTLGAEQTTTTSGKYFTEATKFILVSGFGTDTVKAEVYNGISALKGTSAMVTLNMDGVVGSDVTIRNITPTTVVNTMTYYTESPYTYAQSGQTAMKIDTIILPRAAVSWSGGSGLYYVGDPGYSLVNSWGIDAWKYTLYQDGEAQEVWLTNQPGVTTTNKTGSAANSDIRLLNDRFLNLKDTGSKANDGQPIYTAGHYDQDGVWVAGTYLDNTTAVNGPTVGGVPGSTPVYNATTNRPNLGYMESVTYSAVTRDAQTATFSGNGMPAALLERVAGAKVVNLNAANSPSVGTGANGYVWPGITNLATLNEAGSINPVTGRPLKVSAVVDPSNPLIVTCIYVCWDQR